MGKTDDKYNIMWRKWDKTMANKQNHYAKTVCKAF